MGNARKETAPARARATAIWPHPGGCSLDSAARGALPRGMTGSPAAPRFLVLLGLALLAGCGTPPPPAVAPAPTPAAARAPFLPEKLAAIDAAVARAIADRKIPGGVLWIERAGETYRRTYGQRALVPAPLPATEDTIYDAASLTKVVATTTAVMQLVERGRLELDAPVARYLPPSPNTARSG